MVSSVEKCPSRCHIWRGRAVGRSYTGTFAKNWSNVDTLSQKLTINGTRPCLAVHVMRKTVPAGVERIELTIQTDLGGYLNALQGGRLIDDRYRIAA